MNLNDKTLTVIKSGMEIVGGGLGGAIGLIGGPGSAIAGGAGGVAIGKALAELVDRRFSKRQVKRLGAVALFSLIEIQKRIDNGDNIRDDNFFNEIDGRSKADELLEGVFSKCVESYQEKRIKYLSNIYVNTIFEEVSIESANQIMLISDRLSYQMMCILKLMNLINNGNSFALENKSYRDRDIEDESRFSIRLSLVLQEFMDLYNLGLIKTSNNVAIIDFTDIAPSGMELTNVGKRCFEMLKLEDIEQVDLESLISVLKEST